MQPLIEGAPSIAERLCDACAAHFAAVRAHLEALGITPRLAPRLVRGLDYYTRTTFEFYQSGTHGSQDALGGGGRYDGLVELLGGRPTPGIGFGLGLDRVVNALARAGKETPTLGAPAVVVVGADPDDTVTRLRIATQLRAAGIAARADLARRKLGKQLENAGRDGAHFAVVCGDELIGGQVQLKDLEAGTQRAVNLVDLSREIERAEAQHRHGSRA
jgi:histidyl-tRNA synthetase